MADPSRASDTASTILLATQILVSAGYCDTSGLPILQYHDTVPTISEEPETHWQILA
jgi:hypothetical protein